MLGYGTELVLDFKDECGFEFRMILKALYKYMLIGLLFLTVVMNFICTLNYVLGPPRGRISQNCFTSQKKVRRLFCFLISWVKKGLDQVP